MSLYQSSSAPQSPTEGSAMNWILDHVQSNPDPYQTTLPLRTIYALNCQTASVTTFQLALMEHLQNIPAQPSTLPPIFLTTFIQKCFPQTFQDVDFDQALTALDYLRDLEHRRMKELEKAMRAKGEFDSKIINLRTRSHKLDRTYAVALTGIRRFTLVHELSGSQFNKCNAVALLNTLYPIEEEDINQSLTSSVLSQQRQALWKYIVAVEKSGPGKLDSVRNQGDWEKVSNQVQDYCHRSLVIIQLSEELSRPESFGSYHSDSSVDMPTSPKQSTGRRDSGHDSSESEFEGPAKKSTLEKIVRGLAKLSTKRSHHGDWNAHSKSPYTLGRNPSSKRVFSAEWIGESSEDDRMRN